MLAGRVTQPLLRLVAAWNEIQGVIVAREIAKSIFELPDADPAAAPTADCERANAVLVKSKDAIGYDHLDTSTDVAKVSVIGIGMRSHAGVAAQAFKALAERQINIRAITTSEIKFSLLIDAEYTELAVRTLHSLYGLDK